MITLSEQLARIAPTGICGTIVRLEGTLAAVADFPAPLGAQVEIAGREITGAGIAGPASDPLVGEVVGFRDDLTLVYPWSDFAGVRYGTRVHLRRTTRTIPVGESLLGRVIDARGRVIDGREAPICIDRAPLDRAPPPAMSRPRIDEPLSTGVRAIDGLLTCGVGQRMGIFSGAGVGKSVTLGMMARHSSADVVVIALVGERGREVNEFLARDLGPDGLARSVVVVSTSDEPAPLRVRAAWTATAVAEYFRDRGRNVLLVMDSLTRFAQAQREIGLAAGEPSTTRGYPPSVFALLPKLVERAGRAATGSITGFYSVLVEGDDPREPISDAVRGLLDGHTFLSRKLAGQGHFPAIDVLESLSRLMPDLATREHRAAAGVVRELMSALRDHADLIAIGAYRPGSHAQVDAGLALQAEINRFLRQDVDEASTVEACRRELIRLVEGRRS